MSIPTVFGQPFWYHVGQTLVHFLWQGLLVSVGVWGVVRFLGLKRGNSRYRAYLLAFGLMAACPVATFWMLRDAVPTQALPMAAASLSVQPSGGTAGPAVSADQRLPDTRPLVDDGRVSGSRAQGPREGRSLFMTLLPWGLTLWVMGVFILSARLLLGLVGLCRWRRGLQGLPEPLDQRVVTLCRRLGLGRIRVRMSSRIAESMATGYLRPLVLLPAAMVAQMSPDMLEAIVAHELAHIRRLDLWVNLAQRVMETLFYYHPAVWWLSSRLREERELCCDAWATAATGRPQIYASALEAAQGMRLAAAPSLALGLGHEPGPTLVRIQHVLGLRPRSPDVRCWVAGAIGLLLVGSLAMLTCLACHPSQGRPPRMATTDLVARILASEEKIRDIQCHMTLTVPKKARVLCEADWGYDHGTLFLNEQREVIDKGTSWTIEDRMAFDGQRQWHLTLQPALNGRPTGDISTPDLPTSPTFMTFHTLMGFSATKTQFLSLGQTLAQASSVQVRDREEMIDGRPCLVVEAKELRQDREADPSSYAVRAWIDCQRDYRLLRHELYRSMGTERPFKNLLRRMEHIQLACIQGLWLPVQGECSWPHRPSETRRLTIDASSLRLNQGIPAESFSIRFPKGCEVYDECLDRRYVVGDLSEQEATLSDADWKERMAPLSVEELIAVLGSTELFIEKHKWFAAIHRLVEIGSAAVPELGEALRRKDRPHHRSRASWP